MRETILEFLLARGSVHIPEPDLQIILETLLVIMVEGLLETLRVNIVVISLGQEFLLTLELLLVLLLEISQEHEHLLTLEILPVLLLEPELQRSQEIVLVVM